MTSSILRKNIDDQVETALALIEDDNNDLSIVTIGFHCLEILINKIEESGLYSDHEIVAIHQIYGETSDRYIQK